MIEAIEGSGFIELPVRAAHAAMVSRLPDMHRDPFDRLLVAQALSEPLLLLSADAHLAKYSERVVTV
jgi:PIN domain nuclease of toxin-antitoxin system